MINLIKRTRRQNVIRKVLPFPLVPKVILEDEEEDDEDEDNFPLSQRTRVARATKVE